LEAAQISHVICSGGVAGREKVRNEDFGRQMGGADNIVKEIEERERMKGYDRHVTSSMYLLFFILNKTLFVSIRVVGPSLDRK
jgi:hypothetical protein